MSLVYPEFTSLQVFIQTSIPKIVKESAQKYSFLKGTLTEPDSFLKNPQIKSKIISRAYDNKLEVLEDYRDIIEEISYYLEGNTIIQSFIDDKQKKDEIIENIEELESWVDNSYISVAATKNLINCIDGLITEGFYLLIKHGFSEEIFYEISLNSKKAKNDQIYFQYSFHSILELGINPILQLNNLISLKNEINSNVNILVTDIDDLHQLRYLVCELNITNLAVTDSILNQISNINYDFSKIEFQNLINSLNFLIKPSKKTLEEIKTNTNLNKKENPYTLTQSELEVDNWKKLARDINPVY
jgi:hypothetical protein